MLTHNVKNDKNIELTKLTKEEIIQIKCFENISDDDAVALREFIFRIGIIIYKSIKDEQS